MKKLYLILVVAFTSFSFSQNFHDTQGKLEISDSGQSTFTLPIAMPPSIMDVGPVVNLIYTSGQAGGIAGQGWGINSISTISRVSSRIDIDLIKDGVDFDSNDKLVLDGQRLILKSGSTAYMTAGSLYETEVQSNTKIELIGSGINIYFIVTSPDGSRSWYGNYGGMNGTDLTSFYIVRFEDKNGNFITYHYTKPYGLSLCISEIKFSANTFTNAIPLNRINFTYKPLMRSEFAFIKGLKALKVELLDKVEVFTNNLLFKKYQISHTPDSQGYERISQITESNGANETANPIQFNHDITPNIVTENTIPYTDNINLTTSPDLAGDFDGDGRLDFVAGNQLFLKLFQGGAPNPTIYMPFSTPNFAITTLKNGKLNQSQSLLKINKLNTTTTEFKAYHLNGSSVENIFTKTINLDYTITRTPVNTTGSVMGIQCWTYLLENINSFGSSVAPLATFKEGDFDGDGISDILVTKTSSNYTITNNTPAYPPNTPFNPNNCVFTTTTTGSTTYFLVNMDPNTSNSLGTTGYRSITDSFNCLNNIKQIADFNGDGKSDILAISSNGAYTICELTLTSNFGYTSLIGQGTIVDYTPDKQILYGDFNGDGKTDLMLPNSSGNGCPTCDLWHLYYSNPNPSGGSAFVKESYNITGYFPYSDTYFSDQYHASSYYAMDINKDGKSDFVRVWTNLFQSNAGTDPSNIDSGWQVRSFINNIGYNNNFTANPVDNSAAGQHLNDDNARPIPLISNYRYNRGLESELLIIRYHGNNSFPRTTTFVDFRKDFSEDNLLTRVTQSGGSIVDDISYQRMEPDLGTGELGTLNSFYSSTEELLYPYVELKKMANSKLVSRLQNTSVGVVKKQDFKYHGLSVKVNGLGFVGFKKTARSSWYRNENDKRIWRVTENDPLKRGATIRTYSQLLTGDTPFSFLTTYTTGLINKTENSYTDTTDPSTKRYTILLNNQTTTDYLTNTITEKINNTYTTDYFLPISVTTNKYLGTTLHGSATSITTYADVVTGTGSGYYIGRPTEINSSVTSYVNTLVNGTPDTKTSNIKYIYTNGNVTSIEKKSNGSTETIVESFAYFPNGLLQTKTISATGTSSQNAVSQRTTSYTYDPTNRFISKTTDVEGLISENLSFNNLYGLVLQSKNPYGQITTSTYDNWGKTTTVMDYLGKNTNYSYSKSNNLYTTTQTGDDGSSNIAVSDALARVVRKGTKDINGNWIYVDYEYDFLNKKTKESQPYFSSGSVSQWTLFEYDDYSRRTKITEHTGKIITTAYVGMTITASDPVMSKSKTMNANGQVISATDTPGGTIYYKYDANGNLLESNYDGTTITMSYDNWNRKTQLIDPSAGTYNYTYNAFGETLKEITPNGTTTFNLNSVGKLNYKTVVGLNTNLYSEYSYDNVTKLLTLVDTTDMILGDSYAMEYFYDANKNLSKTLESNSLMFFEKKYEYDSFGRLFREYLFSQNLATGTSTGKWIKNIYNNGYKWKILDDATNQPLWVINDSNARGQVTNTSLGNSITQSSTYDSYGFPTQFKDDRTGASPANIMTLNTTFDSQRGNLTSRYNNMFNWNESFQYDSQDRLTHYTDDSGQLIQQTYEVDGRIKTNNLGTYNYTNSTKKYQNTSVSLSANGQGYYPNRLGIFNDSMEQNVGWLINEPTVVSYDNTTSKTGAASLKINNTTSAEKVVHSEVWTKINNSAPTQYTYSGWVKSNGSNPQVDLFLFMKTESETGYFSLVDNATSVTSNNWTYIEKTFLVPANIKKLSIRLDNNSNGIVWFDDIRIRKTSDTDTPIRKLNISYNAFKSPFQIEETGIDKISFVYNNGLEQRSSMFYGGLQADMMLRTNRKHYSSDRTQEIKHNIITGEVEFITYIGGDGYSAPIVLKSNGVSQEYLYLHRDYQGSILAITNQTGNVIEKRLFDAWGKIIKVQDGQGNTLNSFAVLDRGYTGHEHLQSVGLVNMNGRLYDPKLHRFLQPDNFVQDPYNTQNYNRYGYVLNNPLRYNDPTGEEILAVLLTAAFGSLSYFAINIINDVPITINGAFNAVLFGAISGFFSFGIGSVVASITSPLLKVSVQALAHGFSQGVFSGIQGGGFWKGMATGSISSIASSAWSGGGNWKGLGGKFANSSAGMITFASITGGVTSKLTGGNFWEGAVIGLIVSGLNHALHSENGTAEVSNNEENGVVPSGKIKFKGLTKQELSEFRVIPEDVTVETPIFTPTENGTYKGDGFYHKNFTKEKYWYKVSGGGSVTVTRSNGVYKYTPVVSKFWSSVASAQGKYYRVGWEPKTKPHWTANPFDLKK